MDDRSFSAWLLAKMKVKGVSVQQLADDLDVSVATVYRWRTGSRMPIPDSCQRLATYFDDSNEDLLLLTGWIKQEKS